jgi:2-amino-4-hydroxy-6-hydroxymethyldihydropteridine diphosphokinase
VSARVVIAFGSNQGDREDILRSAVRDVAALDGTRVTAVSALVESYAVKLDGVDEASPNYLNGVLLATTSLAPEELLTELQRIELDHGRVRLERWGDRTLDLDLIAVTAADGTPVQQQSERLVLPHPRAWQRAFVLAPWVQVDADAEIPGRGTVAGLLAPIADTVWARESAPPFDGAAQFDGTMRSDGVAG